MSQHCGYIAIIGRPNVGKSTLLNSVLKQKLSITSHKPQTTQHRLLGLYTEAEHQFVFIDTPGINQQRTKSFNRMLNATAEKILNDVDVVVLMVEARGWRDEDEVVLKLLSPLNLPIILLVNKIDQCKNEALLLATITKMSQQHQFAAIMPICARRQSGLKKFLQLLRPHLPAQSHLFPAEQLTDRNTNFLCAEMIREKIFRFCHQELPYTTAVLINHFCEEEHAFIIHAEIWVEQVSHKGMVIGKDGVKLKAMATRARVDMEKWLKKRVFLRCWCKVKPNWAHDSKLRQQLGYEH